MNFTILIGNFLSISRQITDEKQKKQRSKIFHFPSHTASNPANMPLSGHCWHTGSIIDFVHFKLPDKAAEMGCTLVDDTFSFFRLRT